MTPKVHPRLVEVLVVPVYVRAVTKPVEPPRVVFPPCRPVDDVMGWTTSADGGW